MPEENNPDLHGMVPDKSDVVLLLIDVINDLEWEGGEQLLPHALPMAEHIAALKKRAQEAKIPVVYVNDNFGQWRSDTYSLIQHCTQDAVRGKPVVTLLCPDKDDYFVLKPKHSGFFSTNLDILLDYLDAKTLILTGMAGDICVLFTANDAYMRDFNIVVPADCIASNTPEGNGNALDLMQRVLKADVTPSEQLDLELLQRGEASRASAKKPEVQTPDFASKK
jgi:nicotinamidase-related amidase